MSRAQFVVAAVASGIDPVRAAAAHKAVHRIGANLRHQLARLRDPAARLRAMAVSAALVDQAIAPLAGPSMSVDDGWIQ